MKECWRDSAVLKPHFETLQWRLEEFFTTDTGSQYHEIDNK